MRPYTFLPSDRQRRIDVYSWTGPKDPITDLDVGGEEEEPKKEKPPRGRPEAAGLGAGGLLLILMLLHAVTGRRRTR